MTSSSSDSVSTPAYALTENWFVYEGGPLDMFPDCTLTVDEYLDRQAESPAFDKSREAQRFLAAFISVNTHPFWDGVLRTDPRVAYDPIRDRSYFIFKLGANGTTFIVTQYRMPAIEEGQTFEGARFETLSLVHHGQLVETVELHADVSEAVDPPMQNAAPERHSKRRPVTAMRAEFETIKPLITPAVLELAGYRCRFCESGKKLTIDHIVPLDKGGTNDIRNLGALCGSCNSRKGPR